MCRTVACINHLARVFVLLLAAHRHTCKRAVHETSAPKKYTTPASPRIAGSRLTPTSAAAYKMIRRNPNAAGGRPRRDTHVPANHFVCGRACGSEPAPCDSGAGWRGVFLWSTRLVHRPLAGVPVGGQQQNEYAR